MDEEEHERLIDDLSDTLAGWWNDTTGADTSADEWMDAAEKVLEIGPRGLTSPLSGFRKKEQS